MDPPPYPSKDPYGMPAPQNPPVGPAPPMGYGSTLPMPPPYQPYYISPGVGPNQGPSVQPPQTVIITTLQPTKEPEYLCYSIFTLIFCCLPLGIAAVCFSVQTRKANDTGDYVRARQHSNTTRSLAHAALGFGIVLFFVYVSISVVMSTSVIYMSTSRP